MIRIRSISSAAASSTGIGSQPSFAAKSSKGEVIDTRTWNENTLGREEALKFVIAWLERQDLQPFFRLVEI
jgi:hypothetical protein